jgi:hypothetical protein
MMTITHTKRLLHMSLVIAVVGTITQSPLAVYYALVVVAAIAIGEDIAEGFKEVYQ